MAKTNTAKKASKAIASIDHDPDGLTEEQHAEVLRRLGNSKVRPGHGYDAKEIVTWLNSRGKKNELPRPRPRKVI